MVLSYSSINIYITVVLLLYTINTTVVVLLHDTMILQYNTMILQYHIMILYCCTTVRPMSAVNSLYQRTWINHPRQRRNIYRPCPPAEQMHVSKGVMEEVQQ